MTALDRGGIDEWQRLSAAIRERPWGRVARYVERAVALSQPYGVTELMTEIIERARRDAEQSERDEVSATIRELIATSGCTKAEFAASIGTSASRLSTYASGGVMPSAAMLVRMQRAASSLASGRL